MNTKLIAIILALLVLATACAKPAQPDAEQVTQPEAQTTPEAQPEKQPTPAEQPAPVEQKAPAAEQAPVQLTVALEENMTTGYAWTYELSAQGIVEIAADESLPSDSGLAGAGGSHKWVIAGKAPGKVDIKFSYSRPWESVPAASAQLYHLSVDEKLNVTLDSIEDVTVKLDLPIALADGYFFDRFAFAIKNCGMTEVKSSSEGADGQYDPQFVWCVLYYDAMEKANYADYDGIYTSDKYDSSVYCREDVVEKEMYYQNFARGSLPGEIVLGDFYGNITKADGGYYFSMSDPGDNMVHFAPDAASAVSDGIVVQGDVMYSVYNDEKQDFDDVKYQRGAMLFQPSDESYYDYVFDSFTPIAEE